jgi:hypothetical protein
MEILVWERSLACYRRSLLLTSQLTRMVSAKPEAPTSPFADVKGAFFALSVADIEASAN